MRRLMLAVLLIGCGDNLQKVTPDAATAPVFRNPVSLPDDQLALAALQLLGAQVPGAQTDSCNHCHGLTTQQLRFWGSISDTALATCLTDLQVKSPSSALAMLDCMREGPSPSSDFDTTKLGIFATAAHLPWFAYTFGQAYGADAPAQLSEFFDLAAMPRSDELVFTQAQFDIVAEWFVRGLPAIDQVLVLDPPPTTCQPSISGAVATHVAAMATQGWKALDAEVPLAMFGCGSATDPHLCLQSAPLAIDQPFGGGWEVPGNGHLRVLRDATYATSFWTRSSPDGRFVAHGVADLPGSYVVDLQRDTAIPIAADYDPGFFPDNSGFVFQSGQNNTCAMSVLTSNPTAITMTEPACSSVTSVGLYESLGALLGGGDYFSLDASFVSDDGGKVPTLADPAASFVSNASSSFTPLLYDGAHYVPRATIEVATPFEGDAMMSPSSQLTIARLAGPGDRQLGYVLREIDATLTGSTYTIDAPQIATYCLSGGKPTFSYDERWIVFHHYVGPDDAVELGFTGPTDPDFAPFLTDGAANLYLMDLLTGVAVRITNMHPGQYALYPHFRADGWIYAQVRDAVAHHEYTIASDAAL